MIESIDELSFFKIMPLIWITFIENFRRVCVQLLEKISLWLLMQFVLLPSVYIYRHIIQVCRVVDLASWILRVDEIDPFCEFSWSVCISIRSRLAIPSIHQEPIEKSSSFDFVRVDNHKVRGMCGPTREPSDNNIVRIDIHSWKAHVFECPFL